jgi:glycosyltransferase involved in cell wall biosynthesis
MTRPGESLRSRIHGLTHFFGGVHVAGELQRLGVRHIHAHFGMNPTTLAMVAGGYLDLPFSMTIHARDLFVDTALLPAKIARAKFVVTISEFNRKILEEMAATPDEVRKIHVVHCGINPERFASDPERGEVSDASDSVPRFVAVGRLVPKKGYRYLVEAARILKERDARFEIQIVGGGPDHESLQRRIDELAVGDRVRLLGPLPQESILPLLRSADGFVLPCVRAEDGDQDGIPVSLMEALACEVPCVSTSLSGIPELIEPDKNGFLVPEKEPAALADALEALARDPALRRRLGRAGRSKIVESFSLDVEVRELDRLIRESQPTVDGRQ